MNSESARVRKQQRLVCSGQDADSRLGRGGAEPGSEERDDRAKQRRIVIPWRLEVRNYGRLLQARRLFRSSVVLLDRLIITFEMGFNSLSDQKLKYPAVSQPRGY